LAGTWRHAIEVPGTAQLNTGAFNSAVSSISCASAGNCSAGGSYATGSGGIGNSQAFVVDETDRVWHTAIEVPGTAALNRGGDAKVSSIS
jgi:hypothetical protein